MCVLAPFAAAALLTQLPPNEMGEAVERWPKDLGPYKGDADEALNFWLQPGFRGHQRSEPVDGSVSLLLALKIHK